MFERTMVGSFVAEPLGPDRVHVGSEAMSSSKPSSSSTKRKPQWPDIVRELEHYYSPDPP